MDVRPVTGQDLVVRELTADLWPALEDLFATSGPIGRCWCTYWRIGSAYRRQPALDLAWRLRRVDDVPVWAISCFYIRKGYRRQGVSGVLIAEALESARRADAVAVEAYPLDAELTPSSSHTGYASTFERAGFVTVARHVPPRPITRYAFGSTR
jgi:GNAT superfamily N-acetyltransferase